MAFLDHQSPCVEVLDLLDSWMKVSVRSDSRFQRLWDRGVFPAVLLHSGLQVSLDFYYSLLEDTQCVLELVCLNKQHLLQRDIIWIATDVVSDLCLSKSQSKGTAKWQMNFL